MLIFNLLSFFILGIEILIYYALGVRFFPQVHIADNSSPSTNSTPIPTYSTPVTTTTTLAPSIITSCTLDPDSDSSCNPCPNGSGAGTVNSPNYPSNYGSHPYCAYIYTVSNGNIQMTLEAKANFDRSHPDNIYFHDYGNDNLIGITDPLIVPTTSANVFTTTSGGAGTTTSGAFTFGSSPGRYCTSAVTGPCVWSVTVKAV